MIKFRQRRADEIVAGDMLLIEGIRAGNGVQVTCPSVEAVISVEWIGDDVEFVCSKTEFSTSCNNMVFVI